MQQKRTFKLFNQLYEVHFNLKDEDMLVPFLETKPTLDEFEDYCWSWNIEYKIKHIGENK
jgi:hypothetical protein